MSKEKIFEVIAAFANSPWILWAGFLCGLGIIAWRILALRKDERAKVQVEALDFRGLQQLNFAGIATWLKRNVRGHDPVIDDVVAQIRSNVQLARSGRCLGTFLLSGPTGTGKSFLADLVSEALFPGNPPLVLRMNQYKSPDDVLTLLGPPPGMPGHELGGALTRPVLENRFRVIILDELEKAHPDIFDCLYDILDTGSCREKSSGRLVDFSGCIFFATSNGAVEELRSARTKIGDGDPARLDSAFRTALGLGTKFNKAFIARWERVYFLESLSDAHVAEVACLNLSKYWLQFEMNVKYASPELILQVVLRNREFQEYGVRQLMSFLRMKSDPIVHAARAKGIKDVFLDILPTGEFTLRGKPGVAGAPLKKAA